MFLPALTAFVAVADAGGLQAAADRLGLPCATVVARIRSLERTLGVDLVDGSHRHRTVTTPSGSALLEDARRAVEAVRGMAARAEEVRTRTVGVVRVALIGTADEGVADVVDRLAAADPGWTVDVRAADRWQAGRDLAYGAVDVVVGRGVFAPEPRRGRGRLDRAAECRTVRLDGRVDGPVVVTWRVGWEWSCRAGKRLVALARARAAAERRRLAATPRAMALAKRRARAAAEARRRRREAITMGDDAARRRSAARETAERRRRALAAWSRGDASPQQIVELLLWWAEDRAPPDP